MHSVIFLALTEGKEESARKMKEGKEPKRISRRELWNPKNTCLNT